MIIKLKKNFSVMDTTKCYGHYSPEYGIVILLGLDGYPVYGYDFVFVMVHGYNGLI